MAWSEILGYVIQFITFGAGFGLLDFLRKRHKQRKDAEATTETMKMVDELAQQYRSYLKENVVDWEKIQKDRLKDGEEIYNLKHENFRIKHESALKSTHLQGFINVIKNRTCQMNCGDTAMMDLVLLVENQLSAFEFARKVANTNVNKENQ